ncbi:MAG: sigma-70 family RNA polymerase sigma factor [Ilumatobacteraceae bacterium]
MADVHAIELRAPSPVTRRARAQPVREARDPDALYRELAPAVLGYLRAQGASDPEDLLMEVFVTVVRDLRKVRGDHEAVRRWVFTIAHHRIVDERRWHARRSRMSAAEVERFDDRATPDAMSAGPDPELVAALAELTPDQRDVIGLRLVADLPVADVAKILRRRPDAVKALQHRATSKLAELLGG